MARDHHELSSIFLLRVILTELTSAEYFVNYKACLGDNYITLMCFMLAWLIYIYTSLNFLMQGFWRSLETNSPDPSQFTFQCNSQY